MAAPARSVTLTQMNESRAKTESEGARLFRLVMQRAPLLTLYIAVATPLSILVGLLLGRWALPLVQAGFIFPVFFGLVKRGRVPAALISMTGWAVLTALIMIQLSRALPVYMAERVLLGPAYQTEMFTWIATGAGPEGDIRLFLPQHILHFILFSIVTVLSGGFLGLAMGSVLMNYMSFYVGTLLAESGDAAALALIAWPPWAAVRVLAYILTATGLSALAYDRVGLAEADFERVKRLFAAGAALLVLDVVLKWGLAPMWRAWLQGLVAW